MIGNGWANNCGAELFTLGWVQCVDTPVADPFEEGTYDGVRVTLQEDEELLMICTAFIEIIKCRH